MPSGKRSSSRAGIVGTIYVIVIFSVVVQGLTNGIVLRCAVAAAE
jgi:NhaP-type Na+/H+ or K+/H+ antiporter